LPTTFPPRRQEHIQVSGRGIGMPVSMDTETFCRSRSTEKPLPAFPNFFPRVS
jgi:hypothetical protein